MTTKTNRPTKKNFFKTHRHLRWLLPLFVISIIIAIKCPFSSNTQNGNSSYEKISKTQDGWEIYKNEKYGFELQHPADSTVESHTFGGISPHQYIRIQNYTDQEVITNNGGLVKGQYYLEISIYDHNLGQKSSESCPGNLMSPKRVDLGEDVTAYRGTGAGGGDSASYKYSVCVTGPKVDYYFQASENFESTAGKIIDSLKFQN